MKEGSNDHDGNGGSMVEVMWLEMVLTMVMVVVVW